jgi:hypothetical protein
MLLRPCRTAEGNGIQPRLRHKKAHRDCSRRAASHISCIFLATVLSDSLATSRRSKFCLNAEKRHPVQSIVGGSRWTLPRHDIDRRQGDTVRRCPVRCGLHTAQGDGRSPACYGPPEASLNTTALVHGCTCASVNRELRSPTRHSSLPMLRARCVISCATAPDRLRQAPAAAGCRSPDRQRSDRDHQRRAGAGARRRPNGWRRPTRAPPG